jgi:hypothetical protein
VKTTSSSVVTGFGRVDVVAGLRCPDPNCGHEFGPHDFEVINDTAVRLMCPACHSVAIGIDLEINDGEKEGE